jgi:hypothetical protein
MSIQCCYSYCGFIHFQFFLATFLVAFLAEWDLFLGAAFLETFLVALLGADFTGDAEAAAAPATGAACTAVLLAAVFLVPVVLLVVFFEILLAPTFLVDDALFDTTALAIKINLLSILCL